MTPAFDQGEPRPARDVPPGTSWAFRDHRSLADIPVIEDEQDDA